MDPSQSFNNFNTTTPNVFGAPDFLTPEYLFDAVSRFFVFLYRIIFSNTALDFLHVFTFGFTIFCLTLLAYCAVRMLEIREKEHKHLHHEIAEYALHQQEREKKSWGGDESIRNERWTAVLNHLFSDNLNDWKLAIIEADSMLDALLSQLGFKGNSLGEKLKSADRDTFHSLTSAWEVHTLRNKIAHEGLTFSISHYEAKRVIALYEQIFREFGYI